jgi:OmpA-OmpF porin, OOP family
MRAEAQVLFYFDRHELGQILPDTKARLDNLIAEVSSGRVVPTRILLSGHADISNFTGNKLYNVRLAERRVDTVRDYLVSRGIDWKMIATESRGDSLQVLQCERRKGRKAYEDCLQPNRRVEVVLEGTAPRR